MKRVLLKIFRKAFPARALRGLDEKNLVSNFSQNRFDFLSLLPTMQNILYQYLEWQFLDTPRGIFRAWRNCLRFNLNYWSLPLLFKTFFSHWRRYRYSYGKGFDPGRYFEALTFNMISRAIGAIMRSTLIILGLISEVFIIFAGIIVFLFWLFLPFLLAGGLFYGFKILF